MLPRRSALPGTYFVTSSIQDKRRIFQTDRNAQLFLDILVLYRTNYQLHAYVVMPDHVHLIITPNANITLERCVQFIKGGFSHHLKSKMPVWQKGFTDHRIRDARDYAEHLRYINDNPVLARLCPTPQEFHYSSAHPEHLPLDEVKESLRG